MGRFTEDKEGIREGIREGDTFYNWTALYPLDNKDNWVFECDCKFKTKCLIKLDLVIFGEISNCCLCSTNDKIDFNNVIFIESLFPKECKQCTVCHQTKKITDFNKKGGKYKYQLDTRCRTCRSNSKKHRNRIRYKEDLNFKISQVLRTRLSTALKNNYKCGSAVDDLGCSIDKFKLWIEMQWTKGMNWNNHGFYGWHIDHKIPLASFNLENKEELLKACHYTNLQPLWAKENLSKADKILEN